MEANETEHEALYLRIQPTVSYQFSPGYFIKTGIDSTFLFNQSADGIALGENELDDKTNLGIILGVEYDTRDYETNHIAVAWSALNTDGISMPLVRIMTIRNTPLTTASIKNSLMRTYWRFDFFVQGLSDEEELLGLP